MGLKLRLASWYLPKSALLRELDVVAEATISALDDLLEQNTDSPRRNSSQSPLRGSLTERRAMMASIHNMRVTALVDALGEDEAVRLGREAMFRVGIHLGQEARRRLGVGDGVKDLMRAARVLYRVLGIQFEVQNRGEAHPMLVVNRCELADQYSEVTCLVMSATDEGVVGGLDAEAAMMFVDRIAAGATRCTACIRFQDLR